MDGRQGKRIRDVMVFDITEEEYQNPGKLIDSVQHLVEKEGAFVARLTTWTPTDGKTNMEQVKEALRKDVSFELFHPDLLARETVIEKGAFYIDPLHGSTVPDMDTGKMGRLQRSVQKKILNLNPEVVQGISLDGAKELDVFLEHLLSRLEDKTCDIMYVQNVSLPVPLQTTNNVSMAAMNHNLHSLNGGSKIKGINMPSVYIGFENSTFNCHYEELSFCAVNRHIFGEAKVWFCIPPRFCNAFLQFMTTLPIMEIFKNLRCFIQHKLLWLDYRLVIQGGIPVSTIVQKPGDIVYLLPNTIHFGFNVGMNLNEAMNFVSESWVLPGMLASQRCKCKLEWNAFLDITSTLVQMGADMELINAWKAGHTKDISDYLREKAPLLHPDLCAAGSDYQAPPPKASVAPAYKTSIKMKGGYQCPSGPCSHTKAYRGQGAKTALLNHVRDAHKSDVVKLCALVKAGFRKRTSDSGTHFECQYCGERLSGAKKRRKTHEERCGRKQVEKMIN
ncbi:Lysine-specific demethylase 4D [Frankliniella fusca]|uniref:Lysine-specific demethylase 4D n=1 Tax=Frankliniella fusca TaxID=407009 RepID=A0AAE1GRC4_9NEOP|nr:Lysine-specific demethylase 4D [Frankliniella fusca]